jgi:hypothetical protein
VFRQNRCALIVPADAQRGRLSPAAQLAGICRKKK